MLFNDNWTFYKDGNEQNKIVLSLPHDAMLSEKRDIDNPGGTNISYFAGGKYIYEKDFELHLKEKEKAYFEFEGIYYHSIIYINDKEVYKKAYGYSDFYFEATKYLKDGINHIKVIADNSTQPNSRWYTGSGIYRNVHLFIYKEAHILPRSLKIKTLDHEKGLLSVKAKFSMIGNAKLSINDKEGNEILNKTYQNIDVLDDQITIENPNLWNFDNPYLYTLNLKFEEDEYVEKFGIRTVKLDLQKGLLINGKREILYGACIHHDNGLLGAIDDDFANDRRIRILKDSGYNAIRSAHNPISQSLLNACDKYGMYVLDEYADCWYIHKTKYDYACNAMEDYKEDLLEMVEKDYNHPSVIMYSLGNEVAETSEKKGIEFVDTMTKYVHSLDDSRSVTCGVNIFFNALYSFGFGVYSDKKADDSAKVKPNKKKKKKSVGSEFFNNLAGLLGADFMKFGATLPQSDRKTRGAFAKLDVAGYNYGINRYKHDLKKYPNRFILGTETFCSDSGKFYDIAKDNPRLIGDFVWAGMDYLGEAGIGSWVACENKEIYEDKAGWLSAGSGRIDLLGNPLAEASYTKCAFRQKKIGLGVVSPRDHMLGHSPSSWKMSWALESYDFPGYEGKDTIVEIYSEEPEVKLFLNDKLIFKKKKGNNISGRYKVKMKYQKGTLKAVCYDEKGKEIDSISYGQSKEETVLSLVKEKENITSNELSYINLLFTDVDGNVKPLVNENIEVVEVKNGKLLGLGNACPYYKGSYLDKNTTTYYGRAMAILKPTITEGEMTLKVKSKYGEQEVIIPVNKAEDSVDKHL